jgi:hypothetical protein
MSTGNGSTRVEGLRLNINLNNKRLDNARRTWLRDAFTFSEFISFNVTNGDQALEGVFTRVQPNVILEEPRIESDGVNFSLTRSEKTAKRQKEREIQTMETMAKLREAEKLKASVESQIRSNQDVIPKIQQEVVERKKEIAEAIYNQEETHQMEKSLAGKATFLDIITRKTVDMKAEAEKVEQNLKELSKKVNKAATPFDRKSWRKFDERDFGLIINFAANGNIRAQKMLSNTFVQTLADHIGYEWKEFIGASLKDEHSLAMNRSMLKDMVHGKRFKLLRNVFNVARKPSNYGKILTISPKTGYIKTTNPSFSRAGGQIVKGYTCENLVNHSLFGNCYDMRSSRNNCLARAVLFHHYYDRDVDTETYEDDVHFVANAMRRISHTPKGEQIYISRILGIDKLHTRNNENLNTTLPVLCTRDGVLFNVGDVKVGQPAFGYDSIGANGHFYYIRDVQEVGKKNLRTFVDFEFDLQSSEVKIEKELDYDTSKPKLGKKKKTKKKETKRSPKTRVWKKKNAIDASVAEEKALNAAIRDVEKEKALIEEEEKPKTQTTIGGIRYPEVNADNSTDFINPMETDNDKRGYQMAVANQLADWTVEDSEVSYLEKVEGHLMERIITVSVHTAEDYEVDCDYRNIKGMSAPVKAIVGTSLRLVKWVTEPWGECHVKQVTLPTVMVRQAANSDKNQVVTFDHVRQSVEKDIFTSYNNILDLDRQKRPDFVDILTSYVFGLRNSSTDLNRSYWNQREPFRNPFQRLKQQTFEGDEKPTRYIVTANFEGETCCNIYEFEQGKYITKKKVLAQHDDAKVTNFVITNSEGDSRISLYPENVELTLGGTVQSVARYASLWLGIGSTMVKHFGGKPQHANTMKFVSILCGLCSIMSGDYGMSVGGDYTEFSMLERFVMNIAPIGIARLLMRWKSVRTMMPLFYQLTLLLQSKENNYCLFGIPMLRKDKLIYTSGTRLEEYPDPQ